MHGPRYHCISKDDLLMFIFWHSGQYISLVLDGMLLIGRELAQWDVGERTRFLMLWVLSHTSSIMRWQLWHLTFMILCWQQLLIGEVVESLLRDYTLFIILQIILIVDVSVIIIGVVVFKGILLLISVVVLMMPVLLIICLSVLSLTKLVLMKVQSGVDYHGLCRVASTAVSEVSASSFSLLIIFHIFKYIINLTLSIVIGLSLMARDEDSL